MPLTTCSATRTRLSLKHVLWISVLLNVGCRDWTSVSWKVEASTDWVTGQPALQSIMESATKWSPDAEVIRLYSGVCKKAPREGTCNDWRAVVLSSSQKKSTAFYWRKGIVSQGEVTDGEPKDKQFPIFVTNIKADSDVAFRVAQEHGGKALLERNPETEIRYAMMLDAHVRQLIWMVFYDITGTEMSTAKLRVVLNAQTGKFLQ